MAMVVKSRIIKIGNSQGIRIPKPLLDQSALGEEVELEVQGDRIVIRPSQSARHGWDAAFQAMHAQGDDDLLDGETVSTSAWDEDEWAWT